MKKIKTAIRIVLDTSVWRASNLQLVSSAWFDRQKNTRAGFSDHDHLLATAYWLARAQDATADGGIAGRYSLKSGWSSSYPETTGYIIPTLLHMADFLGKAEYRKRAKRCVDFLLSVQLKSGAFPGMEIAQNQTEPSVFNTAQIVCGLWAWHSDTHEQCVLEAMIRACDWLVAQQDEDGAWRKFTYGGITYTYMAHTACWLGEMGAYLNHQPYLYAARRHLDWVLEHVDSETGWFDKCGFLQEDHEARRAVTHTIAYTIWGVLLLSKILGHDSGMHAARTAAYQVAKRLELSRWLPGVLNWQWRPQARYACLTGNAQMALIWFELDRLRPDPTLISAACKAIDLIKRAQPMFAKDLGIRGGIPGSDPIWGEYLYAQIPNWAAKFFIDALLEKQETMARLSLPRPAAPILPPLIPSSLPSSDAHQPAASRSMRVILYTYPWSDRVQKMVTAWSAWGFSPTAVVVSHKPGLSIGKRLLHKIQEEGIYGVLQKLVRWQGRGGDAKLDPAFGNDPQWNVASFCEQRGIPVVNVGLLDSLEAIAAIKALEPDIAINAGAGILRLGLLAIPHLGTLNAHMGILPPYRGMNVAEWARVFGDVVGCTVHLIDKGIDTGDILCCRPIAIESVASVAELRNKIDKAQLQLLGEVLQYICTTGQLPPRRSQQASEGRQFFVMHPALRAWLDASLQQQFSDSKNRIKRFELFNRLSDPAGRHR